MMTASIHRMILPGEILRYLFTISAMMSVPPVLPPCDIDMPIPAPERIPPIIVDISLPFWTDSVSMIVAGIRS